jgi:branched-chain amino acid transport system permease protein
MFVSIVSYGLAVGAVYALIGITYNVMFSASRVFSFTAGMLGMLGGVLGALFINTLGMNAFVAFLLVLTAGAVLGIVTEILTVRPVLKSIEQHLYVLSTLAFALMVQQVTAIEYNTEPQPFPVLFPIDPNSWLGIVDQKIWLPVLACIVTVLGLEFLYRKTLIGRAFLAIAEDSYAARALGLPETRLRMASFAIAGVIGVLAGFTGAQMLLAFIGNQAILNFYGFVPVALGGMGSNRGAVIGGLALGLFQQAANFLVGGIFAAVAVFAVFIVVLLLRPEGLAGAATARRV